MNDQAQPSPPHMPADRFRALGKRMVDWVADYLHTVQNRRVLPRTKPGDVLAMLPENAPEHPADDHEWDEIFKDLDEIILPNTAHWQHPNYFAYFPCNVSEPAILGEIAAAGLGVQGMLWQTAPASNELERRLLDQLAKAIALPFEFSSDSIAGGGCIQPTASDATLTALVAARHRVLRTDESLTAGKLTIYTSTEAHSSVVKAAMIAGLARDANDRSRIRLIPPSTPNQDGVRIATDPKALNAAIQQDLDAGLVPCAVFATLGTTATGLNDNFEAIHDAMNVLPIKHKPWLHIDAAWAGAALVCEEHRAMLAGVEHADSFCFNPHKWLLTNFDCNLFWTTDRRSLTDSMSISPSYLRTDTDHDDNVFDYRDWGVPLGRKARAIKLWFVLRHYGMSGLRAHIRGHISLAQTLERWVAADPRFVMVEPRSLSLLTIASVQGDEHTRSVIDRVNNSGRASLTPATVSIDGSETLAIRIAVGGVRTTEASVRELWGLLADAADNRS